MKKKKINKKKKGKREREREQLYYQILCSQIIFKPEK